MSELDRNTFNEIVDLLTDRMNDVNERWAFVTQAFFDVKPLLRTIQNSGDARTFTVHLVDESVKFGHVPPGKAAVVLLLEQRRTEVGTDGQAKIDALIARIQSEQQADAPFCA